MSVYFPKQRFQSDANLRIAADDTLLFTLFIASVIHIVLLMGVSFVAPKSANTSKVIEVTLVNSPSKNAPENAKYLAQANQIGTGLEKQKPLPIERKSASSGDYWRKQPLTQSANRDQPLIEHRLITQQHRDEQALSAQKADDTQVENQADQSQPELSVEEIDRQIAQLGAKIETLQESSDKTTIKSINSISAHKFVAAHYIKNWDRKVERIGNLNYPEINGSSEFSGSLTMDVGINSDGQIYDIKIVKSSGMAELDEAAKRIVRMSAPFAELPEKLTEELDVLSIRRVWSFSEEGNFTSH
jgi:protein TonB